MAISVLKMDDDLTRWDEAVKKLQDYDVFYLSGYMKAFQLQGSGEPLLVIYTDRGDYAINAVFRRDVADDKYFREKLEKGKYFDLSSPYGYGGFIGEITDGTKLEDEWNAYCVSEGYICEFVRFSHFSDYKNYFSGKIESHTHNVIRELKMNPDEMWMDFKPKVRKNIKRANTYGLEIIRDPTGERLSDFLRIYYGTMDRANAKKEYYFTEEFFRTLDEMRDNVMYFHTVYRGVIISTELVIYDMENCYSYLGGTDQRYFEMRPNDFLKYEIIKWAKEKGLKQFVLGGGYGSDDGIFEYKKSLAPNGVVDFWVGKKIFNRERYDWLVNLRENGECKSTLFFPKYRAGYN